jgi:histidinol-phosphate aminotransferase
VVKINLTSEYGHDLPKMLAEKDAGLIYICNPNNPTASLTPKDQMRTFLAKVPAQTMVLVDEAYHHYVESNDYESVIPLIAQYPNLIVARTFSKIYSMAGLRCGYCVARPELIQRMRAQQAWDSVNIMAMVAAIASLQDHEQVEQGRRRNAEVKNYVYAELDKAGYKYIPSHANFMMIDLRREVRPVIGAMNDRKVQVGRVFPAMPNFMRVTIGTRPQMEAFVSAFRSVMS